MVSLTQRPAAPIRAPRGTALSCKGWLQEAALRMLMNNLDPDVAERWEDLVVYGGAGGLSAGSRPTRGFSSSRASPSACSELIPTRPAC